MANTLKFGSGNWAAKKDSILAYNDENSNFKPLPFTTSRASTATRINKAGLIEKVENGIARVDYLGSTKGAMLLEPQSTNLIQYSEAFGQNYWTKSGATIQGDPSTAGVEKVVNGDFSSGANWTILSGTTISGGVANINQSGTVQLMYNSLSVTANTFYKVSFEIKNYVSGTCALSLAGYGFQIAATSNGVFTAYANSFANGPLYIYSSSGFVGSLDNVSVKEVSGFASPSAETPLGAFKLVESSANELHRILASGFSVTINTSYTISIIAKSSNRNININGAFIGANATFDLSNGVIKGVSNGTAKIELLANGNYKCSATGIAPATSTDGFYYQINKTSIGDDTYQGDGTSGVYIFGSQLEQKSYATSYIPNYGESAGVTRLAESCIQTPISGIIGQTEGTVFLESNNLYPSGNRTLGMLYTSGSAFYQIYLTPSNQVRVDISGVLLFLSSSITINTKNKIAFSYKSGENVLYINGNQIAVSLNTSIPSSLNNFHLGNFNGNEQSGSFTNSKLYNTRLSNSELQALTTI